MFRIVSESKLIGNSEVQDRLEVTNISAPSLTAIVQCLEQLAEEGYFPHTTFYFSKHSIRPCAQVLQNGLSVLAQDRGIEYKLTLVRQ